MVRDLRAMRFFYCVASYRLIQTRGSCRLSSFLPNTALVFRVKLEDDGPRGGKVSFRGEVKSYKIPRVFPAVSDLTIITVIRFLEIDSLALILAPYTSALPF